MASGWQAIIKESVEQSERLWKPKLQKTIDASKWWHKPSLSSAKAIATTRKKGTDDICIWTSNLPKDTEELWISVGPEGGWSPQEEDMALKKEWSAVQCGESILRTSTASIALTTLIASWRRMKR